MITYSMSEIQKALSDENIGRYSTKYLQDALKVNKIEGLIKGNLIDEASDCNFIAKMIVHNSFTNEEIQSKLKGNIAEILNQITIIQK